MRGNRVTKSGPTLFISVACIALLMAVMLVPVAGASASVDRSVSLVPSTELVAPGESFTVDVVISSDVPSMGAECALHFDPQLVQVEEVSEGDFFEGWAQANGGSSLVLYRPVINNSIGRVSELGITIKGVGPGGPVGTGVFCTYWMTAKRQISGTAALNSKLSLRLDSVLLKDGAGRALDGVTLGNAMVTLRQAPAEVEVRPAVQTPPEVSRPNTSRLGAPPAPAARPAQPALQPSTPTPTPPPQAMRDPWLDIPLASMPPLDVHVLWGGHQPDEPITKMSKLGIGVYGLNAGDGILKTLLVAKPSVLVLQDPNINFARKVRYCFPKAFIVGRIFFAEQPLDNPEQRGREIADLVGEKAVEYKGLIDAWMSYNEPIGHNDYEGYRAYNRFQVAFANRLQGHYGIAAVAGNDPPGAVEPADYPKYFSEAIQASKYFGLHAYSGPEFNALNAPDARYFALRYRLIHEELEKAGIRNVPMVITEAGLGQGWRGQVSEEQMAKDFMWLADEAEKDVYMVGIAIFGLFHSNDWEHFDIGDSRIIDLLGQYQPQRTTNHYWPAAN